MVLTVLGKYGPFPAKEGGTSSYLFQGGGANIALDFGSGAIGRLQKFIDLSELDAIVLSHLHFDHISDLFPLAYYLGVNGKIVDLYAPASSCPQMQMLQSMACFNIIATEEGKAVSVKNLSLSFTQLDHPALNYGVKISNGDVGFFYSGDTVFTDKIAIAAKNCQTLLLDAPLPADVACGAPHMSIAEAHTIAKCCGARVLLTHINPMFSPYEEAARYGLEVVEELAQYEI